MRTIADNRVDSLLWSISKYVEDEQNIQLAAHRHLPTAIPDNTLVGAIAWTSLLSAFLRATGMRDGSHWRPSADQARYDSIGMGPAAGTAFKRAIHRSGASHPPEDKTHPWILYSSEKHPWLTEMTP